MQLFMYKSHLLKRSKVTPLDDELPTLLCSHLQVSQADVLIVFSNNFHFFGFRPAIVLLRLFIEMSCAR